MNLDLDKDATPWASVAAFIYIPLALVGAIWIVLATDRVTLVERLVGANPLFDMMLGIAAGLTLVILGRIMAATWGAARRLEVGLARMLGPVPLRACLILAFLSGIGEEVFFRAAMQPQFGLVATSILFGVLHFPASRELVLWLPLAMMAGFLFGGLFIMTGNIVAPAVAHMVVNARNMSHLAVHWQPGGELHSSEKATAGQTTHSEAINNPPTSG